MDKRVARLWIDRLRNGGIKQVRETLGESNGSRCCLGVLCDIYAEEHPGTGWKHFEYVFSPENHQIVFYADEGHHDAGYLPASVEQWAGMTNDDTLNYASLNDDSLLPFDEIANRIAHDNGV